MPFPYMIILGRDTAMPFTNRNKETAMPFPYMIILG